MINIYKQFYNIREDPFRLSADHHFSYGHPGYKKALTYLNFALYSEEGFVVITGQPGTGKTTLINDLISGLDQNKFSVAHLVTTQIKATDLLYLIATAFGLESDASLKSTILVTLERFLKNNYSAGKRSLLFVDEVQCLNFDSLEELRLLSNIHLEGMQLLQIFLVGQEEFREKIYAENLEQLRQRIIGAAHLEPLTEEETVQYIVHRLKIAGWKNDPKITKSCVLLIHYFSGGIPRIINLISSRLFIFGCINEKHELDDHDMITVLEELKDELVIIDDDISIKEVAGNLRLSGDREYLEVLPAEELGEILDEMEAFLDSSQLTANGFTKYAGFENSLNYAAESTGQEIIENTNQGNESSLLASNTITDYIENSTHHLPKNEVASFILAEQKQLNTYYSQDRFRQFVDQLAPDTSDYGKISVFGMKFRKVYGLAFLLGALIAILVTGADSHLQLFIR